MTRSNGGIRVVVLCARALLGAAVVLCSPFPAFTSSAHADERAQRVLILHAYNYTFPATSMAADGARERLLQRSPKKIELDAEYLDLVRFSEPGHEQLMANFLRERYAQRRPDVVLAVSGEALPFVIKHRDAFAPGVPVVFIGISREAYASSPPPPDVTGHLVDPESNFSETLALAEGLQPDARRLFVIAGAAPTDRRWQTTARTVIDSRARKFEMTYLFELPYDQLLAEVSRIPSDAIVIALTVLRDGAGKPFVAADVASKIANTSKAPVYYPYISAVGKGVVGGYSETFDSMGRAAADIMLEILGGKDPATIPPRTNPETGYRVDYRALQRWNLSESNLPPGTVILNKPPSIWEEHRNLVLAALAVFALQTAFVAALLMQRHRRRRAELLLKESEERMTVTAASANIGLWQFNPESQELWATEHCRTLFGLERNVPLTRDSFLKAIHPEDRELAISALRSAASGGRPSVQDVRVVQPEGSIRWVRVRAQAHPGGGADPGQLSGIFVDLTDQKTAESEAALQRQEVAHLMRVSVLGELSGAIAHEINQPLTAILSNAQTALYLLARDSPDLAEIREALIDIVHEDNRAGQVIQRLRGLLKKGEKSFEEIDVNELIKSTRSLLNSELIARGVSLETELENSLPATFGDPVQLQQILLNLLMNAMDAMSATPAAERLIMVSTRSAPGGGIEVLVRDRGPGLRPEEEARVFEPFYTTKERGLGLGLTICTTILQAHSGKLSLTNGDAAGAVAVLTLPAQEMLIAAQ
ncbi:MAG: ATP-binding protein [Alphaproteobacteria bacterium]